ncbi:MAG: LytTR family DNA-binding domain-containing protein [Bacteroidales bacterium]
MHKLRCMLVDDEPLALELLESYVKKTPYLESIGSYESPLEAFQAIITEQPDLLFLDIQMPDLNGLELARLLPKNCFVVFVTAFQQYALEGFRVNATDYLLKPISYPEFLKASAKVKELALLHKKASSGECEQQSMFVKTEYKLLNVNFADIKYVEGLKDYVKIFLESEPLPVLSRMSMKQLEETLPTRDFIRVHRSFIVRKDKIRIIERNRIVFGKEYIPVSDSYRDSFQEFLSERLPE